MSALGSTVAYSDRVLWGTSMYGAVAHGNHKALTHLIGTDPEVANAALLEASCLMARQVMMIHQLDASDLIDYLGSVTGERARPALATLSLRLEGRRSSDRLYSGILAIGLALLNECAEGQTLDEALQDIRNAAVNIMLAA